MAGIEDRRIERKIRLDPGREVRFLRCGLLRRRIDDYAAQHHGQNQPGSRGAHWGQFTSVRAPFALTLPYARHGCASRGHDGASYRRARPKANPSGVGTKVAQMPTTLNRAPRTL